MRRRAILTTATASMALLFLGLRAGAAEVRGEAKSTHPTDALVRASFEAIRDIVLRHHTLITHRRITQDGARRFADDVLREVDRAVGATTMEGEGHRRVIELLRAIEKGAKEIARGPTTTTAMDGIVGITASLAAYGGEFDHPGWRPLR
jgi:hypothetical protein